MDVNENGTLEQFYRSKVAQHKGFIEVKSGEWCSKCIHSWLNRCLMTLNPLIH